MANIPGISGKEAEKLLTHTGRDDLHQAIRTTVINKRAGGMGLISGRKAFHKPMKEDIKLLNAIQDVYKSDDIAIA